MAGGAENIAWMEQIVIKIDGADIPIPLMDEIIEIIVDTTLHLPTMFSMKFHDETLKWLDSSLFAPGKSLEIGMALGGESEQKIASGEITAVEPVFEDLGITVTVRGYDRAHRLNRGSKTRVFLQMTDSDIVNKIAGEAGLQPQMDSTSEVYEHVYQDGVSDLAFLHQRAERIGYEVYVDDRQLFFKKASASRGTINLEWGVTLRRFHPRLSLAGQVNTVTVKGWDPITKKEIIGQATSSASAPKIGFGKSGGQAAQAAFSEAKQLVVRHPIATQGEADTIAQAALDEINAGFLEADGIALGNPKLIAGKKVSIDKIGDRFKGDYLITSAMHIYAHEGYEVHFKVEGARPRTIIDLITDTSVFYADGSLWGGVVPGLVTNNNDPKNMGRVKLKFPWMDDSLESNWARVSSVGAGNERGFLWLPEVNDEVLVAFEHGDFKRPYVIGSLWNGKDKPVEEASTAVKNGKVVMRTLKTRLGHIIRLVDDDSGDQYIEIIDSQQGTRIKLDAKQKKLTIDCKGEVEINAQKSVSINGQSGVTIKSPSSINIEANGQLTLKGTVVNIN